MSQLFAPSKLVITFETEGQGKFSSLEIENIAVRNANGEVIGLHLPNKSVIIANHQVYTDWWYVWRYVFTILRVWFATNHHKASLILQGHPRICSLFSRRV
jgi:hypothetical protein